MRSAIRLLPVVLGGYALFVAASAEATPNFPGAVQRILNASAVPQCSICHLCGVTGLGTVNTPWGSSMRSRGLRPFNEATLAAALAAMEQDGIDSDADGVIDVDAVRKGKDPNPTGTCSMEDDTIAKYGCVGQVAAGPRPNSAAAILIAGLACLVARRRRLSWRSNADAWLLLLVTAFAAAACRSGLALAPRPDDRRSPSAPRMLPLVSSRMADELRAIDLDPKNLPPFDELSPKQLRRVMSTFTRSLGFACTDCHEASDYRLPTHAKIVTNQMWRDFTRPYALERGALFCDSCHQGQGRFLQRDDKKAISRYMAENFTNQLHRHDAKEVECETCHGDPFEPHILADGARP